MTRTLSRPWRCRRLVTVVLVLLASSLVVGGARVPSVSACSCVGPTDTEASGRAEVVFSGTLKEIRRPTVTFLSQGASRFVFAVDRVFKGQVHDRQSIVSASDGASCGLEIAVGQPALVFAGAPGAEWGDVGEYGAGLCDGTRSLAGGPVPASFGPGVTPLAGSSPIGEDGSLLSVAVRNWYLIAGAVVLLIVGVVTLRRRRTVGPI